jgi:membrane protease YdiL (CAAX protease family)
MLDKVSDWVKHHPILAYFVLTFILSWGVSALLIADHNGLLSVPGGLHYLVSFGPALAALLVTVLTSGRQGLAELLSRIVKWRTSWLVVGLLSPLALTMIAVLANYLMTGNWPDPASLGRVPFLGDIGIVAAILLWAATFGFGEEIGWRGFAFHRLQGKLTLLPASLLIGMMWVFWHLPQLFYNPTYIALGLGGFAGLAIGLLAGSVLLSWLYSRSGSSILVVALWHALFDFTTSTNAAQGTIAAVTSTLVMIWAIVIVVAAIRPRGKKSVQSISTAHSGV